MCVVRDLKPENIFLTEDAESSDGERVKILDFGIAKFLDAEVGRQTSNGMVLGTPKYISPEQCDGRDHLSGKSDVYSLGIIMYEMLAGAAPFHAKAAMAFMRQHMVAIPPSLRDRAPQVPKALHDLIHAMLAKEPAQRPEMAQVAEQLRQLQASNRAGSTQIVPLPPRPTHTALWVVAAGLAVVGLLGVSYVVYQKPRWLPPLLPPTPAVTPSLLPIPRVDLGSAAAGVTPPKLPPAAEVLDAGIVQDASAADLLDAAAAESPDLEPPPAEDPEPPPAETVPTKPPQSKVKPVAKPAPEKPAGKHVKSKPPARRPEPKRHGGKRGKKSRPHASRRGGGRTNHS